MFTNKLSHVQFWRFLLKTRVYFLDTLCVRNKHTMKINDAFAACTNESFLQTIHKQTRKEVQQLGYFWIL